MGQARPLAGNQTPGLPDAALGFLFSIPMVALFCCSGPALRFCRVI